MSTEQPGSGRKRGRRRGAGPGAPRDGQPPRETQPLDSGRPPARGGGRPQFQKRTGPRDGPHRDGQQRGGPRPGGHGGGQGGNPGRVPRGGQGGAHSPRSTPRGQLPEQAIYGINAVSMALQQDMLKAFFFEPGSTNERVTQLHAVAQDKGVQTSPLSKAPWARAVTPDQHQGVAGLIMPVQTHYLEDVVDAAGEDSCILVLDRVQDPQNLGAILRTAVAAGVDGVVLPKAGGAPITPAVHRASAGMSMKVKIVEDENLSRALDYLKEQGYWAIGCDSGADGIEPEDATTFEYPKKRVLVMGNEAEGLRRLVRESCDYIVHIPMLEGVESLNVSVATAVVLYLAKADLARAELEDASE